MEPVLPMSALLSQTLVAFVIEFDNEFERQVPHRTTNHGLTGNSWQVPWLVSMPLWIRVLRFVPKAGVAKQELRLLCGFDSGQMNIWLTRVSKWWRYVTVAADGMVSPTPGREKALDTWSELSAIIEQRWERRYGKQFLELRRSLSEVEERLDPVLLIRPPLDIVCPDRSLRTIPVLLGNILAGFRNKYGSKLEDPPELAANLLRVLDRGEVRVRDIPRLSGIAKEAVARLIKLGIKRGYATEHLQGRTRVLNLTPGGEKVCGEYLKTAAAIDDQWQTTFGASAILSLRKALENLVLPESNDKPRIFRCLNENPEGWHAGLPAQEGLPHYPAISHRGGFPDGS